MATLERAFERKGQEAFLDDAEDRLYGDADSLSDGFRDQANARLEDYGTTNNYDVDGVARSGEVTDTRRGRQSVSARIEWPHPAGLFETGTTHRSPIIGDPLSFVWERRHDPPRWVKEQFEREGDGWRVFLTKVQPDGLPAARFIRDTMASFRANLQRRGPRGRFQ